MLKDFGIFHWLVCSCIFIWLISTNYEGYAIGFSDWENKPCDYATNPNVCQYYNGECGSFRVTAEKNISEMRDRWLEGDTLIIGLDY